MLFSRVGTRLLSYGLFLLWFCPLFSNCFDHLAFSLFVLSLRYLQVRPFCPVPSDLSPSCLAFPFVFIAPCSLFWKIILLSYLFVELVSRLLIFLLSVKY